MDPQSNDYQFGVLSTQILNLSAAVRELTGQVKNLGTEVGEIKLFRAKVIGMSIIASGIVSTLAFIITQTISVWAK